MSVVGRNMGVLASGWIGWVGKGAERISPQVYLKCMEFSLQ